MLKIEIIQPSALYIMDHNGELVVNSGIRVFDDDDRKIILIIIERKGFFRSLTSKDSGRGKYLVGASILKVLKENPDWIKTKVISNKYGI